MMKISVCLGILLMALSGCKSDNNQQASGENMIILVERAYIDLEGNWRFSIGDDTTWASPDYSDNNWEKIKVPGMWEDQGFHGYNGYAWYRKTFEIPENLVEENFILNAGFIDDVDETFVNGKLVGMSGAFPPQFVTSYAAHREYSIPKGLLKSLPIIITPPRGPLSVLCVVVVTICAYGIGFFNKPAAIKPAG